MSVVTGQWPVREELGGIIFMVSMVSNESPLRIKEE
jgi:hypothetical protein